MKKCFTLMCMVLLFLSTVSPVQANTVLFSAQFDSPDMSNWQVVRSQQWSNLTLPCMNKSVPAQWSIVNGELGIVIDGPPCVTEIVPKNLDLTQVQAYEYSFDWRFAESTHMDRNVIFAWKDANNWYDIKILDNHIQIQKVINAFDRIIGDTQSFVFQANQVYHFKITISATKKITVSINDQSVLDLQDIPSFISGFKTLGLQASVGAISRSSSYYDNLVVTSLDAVDGTQLAVPLLKQHDVRWKSLEYDHATQWSDRTTIERWGCALTSIAMVMQFYGLNHLPTGQELTPATLNDWLNSQTDGYIGEGSVNWMAVTRLTRLIHDVLNTPKLEYSRLAGTIDAAKNEISALRPAVLQIDGHFFVGSGITGDGSDLYIKDPAYTYTRFSQHHTNLLSVRKLLPSFTDLSYLLVTHKPGVLMTLKNESGQLITDWQTFSDQLLDVVDGTKKNQELVEHQLAKPASGKYLLEVTANQTQPFSFQTYIYDQQANPILSTQTGVASSQPTQYIIEYKKDGVSTIQKQVTLSQLQRDLRYLKEARQFTSSYGVTQIDQLLNQALQSAQTRQLRYLQSIEQLLKQYASFQTTFAQQLLRDEVSTLIKSL
jgi:hypothetical protein